MAVITVFRQVGCKGRYIAEELARALDYNFSDYRVAERLLLQHGFEQAPKVYQSTPDFWDHFTRRGLERDEVNHMLRSVTLAQAQHGNVVMLGRGCFGLLQGLSDVINVRVKAPLEVRIARVMSDKGLAEAEAITFVKEKDELVADFARTSTGLSPDDCSLFDVIIDTGTVDPDAAVRFLVDVARSVAGGSQARPTAAQLQVDPVIANAVSDEFGRLEHLRSEGYEVR